MRNPETPISSSEEDALESLEEYVGTIADDGPLTREEAVEHLMEGGEERSDARESIEQLLLKGYLYEVNDDLRIPHARSLR